MTPEISRRTLLNQTQKGFPLRHELWVNDAIYTQASLIGAKHPHPNWSKAVFESLSCKLFCRLSVLLFLLSSMWKAVCRLSTRMVLWNFACHYSLMRLGNVQSWSTPVNKTIGNTDTSPVIKRMLDSTNNAGDHSFTWSCDPSWTKCSTDNSDAYSTQTVNSPSLNLKFT